MAGQVDLTDLVAKRVIAAVKRAVPRSARSKIGLTTRIDGLGMSAAELRKLYAKIGKDFPIAGASGLEPFARVKTVKDIVTILTEQPKKAARKTKPTSRKKSAKKAFKKAARKSAKQASPKKAKAARSPSVAIPYGGGKGGWEYEGSDGGYRGGGGRRKFARAKPSRGGAVRPGRTKKAKKRKPAGTGGSGPRKTTTKAKPSHGGWSQPAPKPALPGFEGGSGSIPVDETAPRITKSRKRAKPPLRGQDFPGPGLEAIGGDRIEAEPIAAPASATTPPLPETERQINIWIGEGKQNFKRELKIGETYAVNFKVGFPVEESFTSGPGAAVPSSDIPAGGLPVQWLVISSDAELVEGTADTKVTAETVGGVQTWSGQFDLRIPETGDSAVAQLKIKPLKAGPRIDVILTVKGKLYRKFKIALAASDSPTAKPAEPARVYDDQLPISTAHVGLRTTHEWTTPSEELTIDVIDLRAPVRGFAGGKPAKSIEQWVGLPSVVDGPIKNVRAAAERLRAAGEKHFNNIDPQDLADRLRNWHPEYWDAPHNHADAAHQQAWDQMAAGPDLRALAIQGRNLFQAFFPNGSKLSGWLAALLPGARLNISCTPLGGIGFMPHVPWGLMYLADVPPGQPIDPMNFLGLRCRIAYDSHDSNADSLSLGRLDQTHRAHLLYWGEDPADETGNEARWQRAQWGGWPNQVFVPSAPLNAKAELLQALERPVPAPTSVLYLFCQCNTDAANSPALRFGDTNDDANMVTQLDFTTTALADQPLVFANACTTAAADSYMANELEQTFFRRQCRAFLGTETKVPIAFGSRFATIFFHFFYRLLDPKPMAAGEAVAQTRLFLWTHYRNIGGLFYCYVNQFDLVLASDDEVRNLR